MVRQLTIFWSVACREKENPPLWGMGVVAVAIIVRFLHSLAQKELSVMVLSVYSDATPAILTLVLACIQVAAAVSIFRVSGLSFSTSPTNREAAIIGILAYAGSLYLNNYLLWSNASASVACYGVQEPVLCMLLLYAAARIPTDSHRAGAVVCFCIGSALLTAEFSILGDVGAVLRVLASVFLLVRNMVTKHLYDSSVSFNPRNQNTMMLVAASGTILAVLLAILISRELLMASLMMVVTTILSVTLLYLMFMMLLLYDTLTVAVFMLWAQVLENVIFVEAASRPGLISVILGATMFAAGHYIYFKEGLESGTVHLNIKQGKFGHPIGSL